MKQRIQYIDRLKGVLILLVVSGHLIGFALKQKPDPIFLNVLDSFQMPMFMFLSGLVISKPPSIKKSIIKFVSLIMPVLTIGILFSLYRFKTIEHLFFDNMKVGYWYLFVLAEFYLVMSFFNIKIIKEKKGGDIIFAFFIYLGIALINKISSPTINGLFSFRQCYAYWPWFVFGVITNKYKLIELLFKNNWIYTICIILAIPTLYAILHGQSYLMKLANICPIVILLYIFSKRENYSSSVTNELSRIGRHTLDIYIYHFFIVVNINFQDFGKWLTNTDNQILETLFVLLMALLVSYISIIIGKLIKNSHFLESVIYGKFITKVLSL